MADTSDAIAVRSDADNFLARLVSLVVEATEPSLADEEAAQRVAHLVALSNTGLSGFAVGGKVALALRKRLKSHDPAAVMNALLLLDELMRSVPYFYWHIGEKKMWRQLWRFVQPNYKMCMHNRVRSMMTHVREPCIKHANVRNADAATKVLTMIRAWAEDLSIMFDGRSTQFDPPAAFIIEQYKSKRHSVRFPQVPESEMPWICPVGLNAYKNASNVYAARGPSRKVSQDGVPMWRFSAV